MNETPQTITVLGAGYVGLTTAALLSNAGFTVYVVEPNPSRLETLRNGESFFYEIGINPIIKKGLSQNTLIPTDSYAESVPKSTVVFSCVGTPDNPDGSSNLTYVFSAAKETLQHAKSGTIYVQKSTVPVGTGGKIEALFANESASLSYVSNPEFLREGTAILDTLFFDRVVVGSEDNKAAQIILDIYHQLESYRDKIVATANLTPNTSTGKYIKTSLNSAELIKVTANAFLALKISFANSIAKLSDEVNADINEVMDAVGADKRIGRAFLNAGRGYGGGCFPKDVSGLISSGLEYGVDLEIMQAAQSVNASMPGYIIEKLKNAFEAGLEGKRIAVLGLAFKAGTSDVRKSPGVAMANLLSSQGATVVAYDPQANEEAKHDLRRNVTIADTAQEALVNSNAVIVATDWPELTSVDLNKLLDDRCEVFVDAVNAFSPAVINKYDIEYIGVGR